MLHPVANHVSTHPNSHDALEGEGLWLEISGVLLDVWQRHGKINQVLALSPLDCWFLAVEG